MPKFRLCRVVLRDSDDAAAVREILRLASSVSVSRICTIPCGTCIICTNPDCVFVRIKIAAYNIYFRQDEKAAAKGELTLHIGNGKQRAGIIARSWPRPNVYTRLGGSPQSGSARRPGANVVRLQADHLDRG
jgi:hypothetical protein